MQCIVPTFLVVVTHQYPQRTILNKRRAVTDGAKAVHRVLECSDSSIFLMPASYVETEIERDVREQITTFLGKLHRIQGTRSKGYMRVCCAWRFFKGQTTATASQLGHRPQAVTCSLNDLDVSSVMPLKGMVESSRLSKDEPLTPNIDGVMAL